MSANPQSTTFRQKVGRANVEKLVNTRLLRKLTRNQTQAYHQPSSKFLLHGDCQGWLTIWNLDMNVPAAALVLEQKNSAIIIMPAIDFLAKHLFRSSTKATDSGANKSFMKLKKHNAKVICILYPHAEYARYDPNCQVSLMQAFTLLSAVGEYGHELGA